MEVWQAVVLGAVQGLTEFLPISSSGHLILIPKLLGWSDPGLTFDVALHMGTLLAVLVFYFKTWLDVFAGKYGNFSRNIIWLIAVGSIPGAIVGALGDNFIEENFRSEILIAGNLIFFGLVLWLADKYSSKKRELADVRISDAAWVGLAQALALIPGISRSGITITAGLFRGIKSADAANFSFLLSTPIIAGAGLFKLRNLFGGNISSADTQLMAVGFISSAIVGFAAIKFLLDYLRKSDLSLFVWYRLLVGVGVLLYVLTRT